MRRLSRSSVGSGTASSAGWRNSTRRTTSPGRKRTGAPRRRSLRSPECGPATETTVWRPKLRSDERRFDLRDDALASHHLHQKIRVMVWQQSPRRPNTRCRVLSRRNLHCRATWSVEPSGSSRLRASPHQPRTFRASQLDLHTALALAREKDGRLRRLGRSIRWRLGLAGRTFITLPPPR